MTAEMIEIWCHDWAAECVDASESVQRPEDIQRAVEKNVNALRVLSDRLYAQWTAGLQQD
jgi:hypothetical protein